jgi:hypothetical protein
MIGKYWEMVALTKKGGQVRRKRIRDGFPLARSIRRFQAIKVVTEGSHADDPQPACQAAVNHLVLARRKRNAGVFVDQYTPARNSPT